MLSLHQRRCLPAGPYRQAAVKRTDLRPPQNIATVFQGLESSIMKVSPLAIATAMLWAVGAASALAQTASPTAAKPVAYDYSYYYQTEAQPSPSDQAAVAPASAAADYAMADTVSLGGCGASACDNCGGCGCRLFGCFPWP